MSFLDECRERGRTAWAAYENHPWIEALAQGTLTTGQFTFFQLDDGAHVVEFNRTLALGIAKAPMGHPWAAAATQVLANQSTSSELSEKRRLVAELGFDVPLRHDRWSCSPAREGYVNHLVRIGHEGTLADIAAGLYPCSLFTQVIGRRFDGVRIPGPPAFQRWADMYTRRHRSRMCEQHASVVEEAALRLDDDGRRRLYRIYLRSLEHQIRVFDAAWLLEGSWPGGAQAYGLDVVNAAATPR